MEDGSEIRQRGQRVADGKQGGQWRGRRAMGGRNQTAGRKEEKSDERRSREGFGERRENDVDVCLLFQL